MTELLPTEKDLVWQLRTHSTDTAWIRDLLMRSAADEIERLRAVLRCIQTLPDEENEWDAVDLYEKARQLAAAAFVDAPRSALDVPK